MEELRAIICYRRSSPNQRGRVGDFVELPEHKELAYKGRLYGPDDIEDFNRDVKALTVDRRFFQPPYVKLLMVDLGAKKKTTPVRPERTPEPTPTPEKPVNNVQPDGINEVKEGTGKKPAPTKKAAAKKKTTEAKK